MTGTAFPATVSAVSDERNTSSRSKGDALCAMSSMKALPTDAVLARTDVPWVDDRVGEIALDQAWVVTHRGVIDDKLSQAMRAEECKLP